MKEQTIFYGAGKHAEESFKRWVLEGIKPVCFADIDEQKHYKTLNGLDIFPLSEAINRYPDYVLYLTHAYENLHKVTDYLIEYGIPRERIKYADNYEWRKGCNYIGKHITFTYNSIRFCCLADYAQEINRTENIETDMKNANEYITKLIDDFRCRTNWR